MNTPPSPASVGSFVESHCYLCEKTITERDALVVNGGVQVIVRRGLHAHRRCWLTRYGEPREGQAEMEFEGEI